MDHNYWPSKLLFVSNIFFNFVINFLLAVISPYEMPTKQYSTLWSPPAVDKLIPANGVFPESGLVTHRSAETSWYFIHENEIEEHAFELYRRGMDQK